MKKNKWNRENILQLMEMNEQAVVRGLIRIYERQTEDEKKMEQTHVDNGVGFTGADSKFMTILAKFYIQNGYLSFKQMEIVKKRMKKYAGQLAKIANENEIKKQKQIG